MSNNLNLPAYQRISEPYLTFSPERDDCVDIHPLRGLIKYGPYNQKLINNAFNKIRVATLGPAGTKGVIANLISGMKSRHFPVQRKYYLIEYPGFSQIFKKEIVLSDNVHLEIPVPVEKEILKAPKPYIELAQAFSQAIAKLSANKFEFDILFIYLPEKWQSCFESKDSDDFDLHDFIKALCVGYGIPTQIIREDKALNYECQCSVMWHLSIAVYSKITGVPWKLADTCPDTAYIGMSYAVRSQGKQEKPKFVTCCSQVFDAEGSGLEFVAYETRDFETDYNDNPFLSRDEMRKVMGRCLNIYQERNAGKPPKNIVIHKSTEFRPEEIDGCYDALRVCENIELIQVQQNVAWKGIKFENKGQPASYPCDRGTYMHLDNSVLLWTQGDIKLSESVKHYYKEGRGTPSPILLSRYAGHGSWYESCRSVLALSKMNWNSDSLYDRLPVTLEFAKKLATTIKRMPELDSKPYQYRFFM